LCRSVDGVVVRAAKGAVLRWRNTPAGAETAVRGPFGLVVGSESMSVLRELIHAHGRVCGGPGRGVQRCRAALRGRRLAGVKCPGT